MTTAHLSVLPRLRCPLLRLQRHGISIGSPLLGGSKLNDQLLLLCRHPGGDDCCSGRLGRRLLLRCRLLGTSQLALQVGAPTGKLLRCRGKGKIGCRQATARIQQKQCTP